MFERYSERSRRVVFYARFWAVCRGSSEIEPRDLFLGATHDKHQAGCPFEKLHEEAAKLRDTLVPSGSLVFDFEENGSAPSDAIQAVRRLFKERSRTGFPSADGVPVEGSLRDEVLGLLEEKGFTLNALGDSLIVSNRNPPLSRTGKMALAYAAQEADRDRRYTIGSDHLVRGVLRTQDAVVEQLKSIGYTLAAMRSASMESQKRNPTQAVPLRWWLRRYRRLIAVFLGSIALAAAILYMRSQP